ncbi:hypothetical protein [Caballeronia sp. J97]|uniref:hypothetical protein n=1 Tax=Caballeronia sp. J97 TaxID=2805429 RepID=UPI002AB1CD92|nr:hypothetical protein [Caballeronia sp. J97]
MLDDTALGWIQRGQYAIWTGANDLGGAKYRLLERRGNRVIIISAVSGAPVMHRISSGTSFTVENLFGYWVSFDSDAIWLDIPRTRAQYAVLAVGGAEGKPAKAIVDCPCPKCGNSLNSQTFAIPPLGFKKLLDFADDWASNFNGSVRDRTCASCGFVHPIIALAGLNVEQRTLRT